MKSPKRRPERLRALCAEFSEEDGMDPRDVYSREREHPHDAANRKTVQLCKQVARSLQSALTMSGDSRLHDLDVVRVEPAPNSGRLRVIVQPSTRLDPRQKAAMDASLSAAIGFLRREIAQAITRKRVPEIVLEIMEVPNGSC